MVWRSVAGLLVVDDFLRLHRHATVRSAELAIGVIAIVRSALLSNVAGSDDIIAVTRAGKAADSRAATAIVARNASRIVLSSEMPPF